MPSQVKVACLECRSFKIRCDGRQPCLNCSSNNRECQYRPSQRGGARRGTKYHLAKKQRTAAVNDAPIATIPSPIVSNAFPDDTLNADRSVHPFQNAPEFAPRSNAHSAPTSGLFGNVGTTTSPDVPHHVSEVFTIRSYRNSQDLVNAYYIHIHPYLPLFPPPITPLFADTPQGIVLTSTETGESTLPNWLGSPLEFALMAILVLIPQPEDPNPMGMGQVEARKSQAHRYAQAALQSISNCSAGRAESRKNPVSTPRLDEVSRSPLHAELPATLEPVLALLLLGVYEYCQNSDRRQMRCRIYEALILAMDLSLHVRDTTDPQDDPIQARVWWMTMFLAYQSAIFNRSSPIMLIDDRRIEIGFPNIGGCSELWPILMRAQEAMLQTGLIAKEMNDGIAKGDHGTIRNKIQDLNASVLALTIDLDQPLEPISCEGPDGAAVRNLWLMARYLAHTSRLKLHRFRAFGDYPVFLDRFCDLSSINNLFFSDLPVPVSPNWLLDVTTFHPFTEEESTHICLRSALVISRVMREISWPSVSYSDDAACISTFTPYRVKYPRSLPYMACCGMQACYVFMMVLRKIRTSMSSNDFSASRYLLGPMEPGTEWQAAERFIEELRHGVKSVCAFMSANFVFGGIIDMAREVETVYLTHFSD